MEAALPVPQQHLAMLEGLDDFDSRRVLDVGCGSGGMVRALLERGADAHGIDVQEAPLRKAAANGVAGERLALFDGHRLPSDTGSFDIVLFTFSFHHVPGESRRTMLEDVARVLKSNGEMIAFEPRPEGALSEVLKPIEDETAVRTEAQRLLADPPAPLACVDEREYAIERDFTGFDDFLQGIVLVDPARASAVGKPSIRAEAEKRFERLAVPMGNGRHRLSQPSRLFRLRLC